MTPVASEFDLLGVKLAGSHLLEAGAGTGKTYSLSFLYLRLLLEKALTVEQIVVTTFTKAATAELKTRIYSRLAEAENYLQGQPNDNDPLLCQLLDSLRIRIDDSTLKNRLRLAQAQFDRAHIHSINGFALQLLKAHAVTLDSYAPEVILDDNHELIKAAYIALAHDNFAELDTALLAATVGPADQTIVAQTAGQTTAQTIGQIIADFSTNQRLLDLLTAMHEHFDALCLGETLFPDSAQASALFASAADKLLNADHRTAVAIIQSAIASKHLKNTTYKPEKLLAMTERLENLTDCTPQQHDLFDFFSTEKLLNTRSKAAKQADLSFDHPLFAACQTLRELTDSITQSRAIERYFALKHLLQAVDKRLHTQKTEQLALTHDEVVAIVAAGAKRLKLPLKAALIDEAQDTNREQLSLFKTLFMSADKPDICCFFVGDPKQAIYGFRDSNIYSYLAIKNEVDACHRLPVNYRSSQALNVSINTLFAPNPFAMPGTSSATLSAAGAIDYTPIRWHKPNHLSSFADVALHLLNSDSADKVEDLAGIAARYLVTLLNDPKHYLTDARHPDGKRPLRGGDIAVLVRSNTQAEHLRTAFAAVGLTVAYSGKKSLFDSDEALLLLTVLQGLCHNDERRLRSIMLSPWFDFSHEDLLQQTTVDAFIQQISRLGTDFYRHGFATLFYRLMTHFGIAARLLAKHDKRGLSNLIQLFEFLQTAAEQQNLTLHALTDYLARTIAHGDEESPLRLEDNNAVTIMTMHHAKGLEFPVVCLPFFHYHRPKNADANTLRISRSLDPNHSIAALNGLNIAPINQACASEEQAEAMRLAYVALTRATYLNIIITRPPDSKHISGSLWQRLQDLQPHPISGQAFCRTCAVPAEEVFYQTPKPPAIIYQAPLLLTRQWTLSSFSALQQRAEKALLTTTAISPASQVLSSSSPSGFSAMPEPVSRALLDFPAGAKPGVALHAIYENYMLHRLNNTGFRQFARRQLAPLFNRPPAAEQVTALLQAILHTTTITLSPNNFALEAIDSTRQRIEMPFFLHLSAAQKQYLLDRFGLSDKQAIAGFLHGFIDYCFAYQGKYYVLDYKSNKLGEHIDDYHQTAMHAAMLEHHYDLQALIYTAALCKHLHIFDADSYHKYIGGCYYLFIRGMNSQPATADHGIYFHCLDWQQLQPLLGNEAEVKAGEARQ